MARFTAAGAAFALAAAIWAASGLAVTPLARAHEIRPARLQIVETGESSYEVTFKCPARGPAVLRLAPVFPEDCEPVSSRRRSTGDSAVERTLLRCARPLSGRVVSIEGLESTLIDALATVELRNGDSQSILLRSDAPSFEVARVPTRVQVARGYFVLGVEHILLGVDHLLFVLGLLLILSGWRQLVSAITAFTVSHSITLALASLGLVHVPQGPVEAVIALSIVFLATEYAHQLGGTVGWTALHPWSVSFVVGLLHGLGFAGALAEVGLPQADIPVALLTFNLGVEAGQLLFVTAVLAVFARTRRFVERAPRGATWAAAYGMGAVAAYWFVERTTGLL